MDKQQLIKELTAIKDGMREVCQNTHSLETALECGKVYNAISHILRDLSKDNSQ